MITLPTPPRRAQLRAFWLVFCGLSCIAALICTYLLGLSHPALVPVGVLAILAVPGLASPEWVRGIYAGWNRAARIAARGTRRILLTLCLYIIFTVVGRAGARFVRFPPLIRQSGWTPRHAATRTDGREEPGSGAKGGTEIRSRRLSDGDNAWTIFLTPFLALIAIVADEEKECVPKYNYTLF